MTSEQGQAPQLTWVLCAALLLLGSIVVSAATTTDPDWWQLYFSRLGMMSDFSSVAFNGGLILSGAVIACSSWMLRVRLQSTAHASTRTRIAMHLMPPAIAGLGLSLLAIGAFPLSVDPAAHDRATNGAVLSFAALLLSHRLLLWQLSPALRRASMISAVAMIAGLVALKAEVISLTIFEAIAFAAILWWVHLLEHCARMQVRRPDARGTRSVRIRRRMRGSSTLSEPAASEAVPLLTGIPVLASTATVADDDSDARIGTDLVRIDVDHGRGGAGRAQTADHNHAGRGGCAAPRRPRRRALHPLPVTSSRPGTRAPASHVRAHRRDRRDARGDLAQRR